MCRYQQKVPQHDYLLDTPVVDVRRIGLTFSLKNLRTFGSRKPRPNDSNISTQHVPTLLAQYLQGPVKQSQQLNGTDRNIFGRDTLHTFGHPVATCCELKNGTSAHAHAQHCCTNLAKWLHYHATSTNVAWKIWPFLNLSHLNLLENVATGWPNARNTVAPNNVAICCVVNLAIVWPWRYCLPLFDENKVFNTGGRGKREEGRKKGWEAWALTTRLAFLLYIANQAPTISSLPYLLHDLT